MTTFRKKFRFDSSSYRYARFILSYAPVVLFGWGVWVFGNTTFISTDNIIEGKITANGRLQNRTTKRGS